VIVFTGKEDMHAYQERFFRTNDGRQLYFRDYSNASSRMPVIGIPGLQTNSRAFEYIAPLMAKSRRVLCIDPRGRGRSDYDTDPGNYTLKREATDVFQMAKEAGVARAVVFGLSRGGLSGLLLAAGTNLAAGLILVDIGPEIELAVMARLAQDVATFPNWGAAAEALKKGHGAWFPGWSDQKWHTWARMKYKEEGGRIIPDFDPQLIMRAGDPNRAPTGRGKIALWQAFRRLPRLPILVLRGEHSDVLSERTVATMKAIRPITVAVTIKGCGHLPLLDEPESIVAIDVFLERFR
jgi:pimeloyl-ACP methyl ester carboxylesterase